MSRPRFVWWCALLVPALLLGGCTTKYEVVSDTSWRGWVEDHSVDGSGCTVYTARQGGYATFTKTTERGFLRARVKGFWGDERWVETTSPYGTVVVAASRYGD